MTEKPIVFFDSGIGGLTYLVHARESLPLEDFIYVADRKNFPYGDKPSGRVLELVGNTIGRIVRQFNPKAVVVACNTASVIALSFLRGEFEIPFVGVVPAVKPAAENSKRRKIGIFATNRTVNDSYTENLIRDFAEDCTVVSYPGSDTVSYIEKSYFFQTGDERSGYISGLSSRFIQDGIDSLVLGCTHFVYISELLQEKMKDSIEVIDSRRGVTRQLIRVLTDQELLISVRQGEAEKTRIYTTTSNNGENTLFPLLADWYGMTFIGPLK
jgi:glutamate racemase